MNMLLYFRVPRYLAEWTIHEFGGQNPVQLPRKSPESDILRMFLTRQPDDVPVDLGLGANLSVVIPTFKHPDPDWRRGYYYLPPKASFAFISRLKTRFKIQLWEELFILDNQQREISALVYAWMEKHGIADDPTSWETIRQAYYRCRKIMTKNCAE